MCLLGLRQRDGSLVTRFVSVSPAKTLPAQQLLYMAHKLGGERRLGWAFGSILVSTKRNNMLSRSRADQCQAGSAGTQRVDSEWGSLKAFVPKQAQSKQQEGQGRTRHAFGSGRVQGEAAVLVTYASASR